MSTSKFCIPEEFHNDIKYIEYQDTRSDDEIVASLSQFQPVTSEKNIWAYWDSGFSSVPSWCKRNVIDWVRINSRSGWTVRILDSVQGSPNHFLKYIPATYLPDAFVADKMDGPYSGPHSADFLRGASLFLHGGVYMDLGIILIRALDRICWNQLTSASSPYRVAVPLMYGQNIANHFVAARKHDPFIKRWHELFVSLWKDRTNYKGLRENPLLALPKKSNFEESRSSNFHWDFSVPASTVFEYITQVLCWQRLTMLEPPESASTSNSKEQEDTFNCSAYWEHNILVFDVLQENWAAEQLLGFHNGGLKILKCLKTPLSADPASQQYKDAYAMTWRLLTRSSMQKVTHGKGLTKDLSLGYLLDQPENENADCAPGTFGELLRWGAVHLEQTRENIVLMEAKRAPEILRKGVFEP